jgi:hypothetical protein
MLLKEAENIFLFAIIGQGHITLRTEENFVQSRLERALAGAISGAAGKHDCVAETNSRSYNSSLARLVSPPASSSFYNILHFTGALPAIPENQVSTDC